MIKIKAWNARPLLDILSLRHWHFPVRRNSTAIAKFHNADIDHFGYKMFAHDLIRGSLVRKKKQIASQANTRAKQGWQACYLAEKALIQKFEIKLFSSRL